MFLRQCSQGFHCSFSQDILRAHAYPDTFRIRRLLTFACPYAAILDARHIYSLRPNQAQKHLQPTSRLQLPRSAVTSPSRFWAVLLVILVKLRQPEAGNQWPYACTTVSISPKKRASRFSTMAVHLESLRYHKCILLQKLYPSVVKLVNHAKPQAAARRKLLTEKSLAGQQSWTPSASSKVTDLWYKRSSSRQCCSRAYPLCKTF